MKRPNLMAAILFLAGLTNNVQAIAKENVPTVTEASMDKEAQEIAKIEEVFGLLQQPTDAKSKQSILEKLRNQGRLTILVSGGGSVCN